MIDCKLCNKQYKSPSKIIEHVKKTHGFLNSQQYYDKFYKIEKYGICIDCGDNTQFVSFRNGYLNRCPICRKKDRIKRMVNTLRTNLQKRYGEEVTCISKIPGYFAKVKATKLLRYGNENYTNPEKAKQTCLKKWKYFLYWNRQL